MKREPAGDGRARRRGQARLGDGIRDVSAQTAAEKGTRCAPRVRQIGTPARGAPRRPARPAAGASGERPDEGRVAHLDRRRAGRPRSTGVDRSGSIGLGRRGVRTAPRGSANDDERARAVAPRVGGAASPRHDGSAAQSTRARGRRERARGPRHAVPVAGHHERRGDSGPRRVPDADEGLELARDAARVARRPAPADGLGHGRPRGRRRAARPGAAQSASRKRGRTSPRRGPSGPLALPFLRRRRRRQQLVKGISAGRLALVRSGARADAAPAPALWVVVASSTAACVVGAGAPELLDEHLGLLVGLDAAQLRGASSRLSGGRPRPGFRLLWLHPSLISRRRHGAIM